MYRLPFLIILCALFPGGVTASWAAPDPEVFGDEPAAAPAAPAKPEPAKAGEERIDLESLFPASGRVYGWKRMFDEASGYADWQLEEILGPGADLYREYSVEELRSLDYELENSEISIELFRTSKSDGAYGLYTIFNAAFGDETPVILTNVEAGPKSEPGKVTTGQVRAEGKNIPPAVGDNYRIYPGQGAEFFKGRVYGRIRTFGEINDLHMLALTFAILERIPRDAPRPPVLRELPKPGMLTNSQRYVVGPLSVYELNYPVPAELWGVSGSSRAASARYRFGVNETYDLLVVQYGNPSWAASRYQSVKDFLSGDPDFDVFPASSRVPQPFFCARAKGDERFVGLHLSVDRIYFYAGVPNATLFDRILTTSTQISVRNS